MMGGTISVQSVVGAGSTFAVHMGFERAPAGDVTVLSVEKKRTPRHTTLSGRTPTGDARILVAEDHAMNQMFIKKLLEQFGARDIDIAQDGEKALEALKNKHYHVVLMDGHMPVMNGYDTTTEQRRREMTTSTRVPIVALTANAMTGDRDRCIACGMDDYISKPIAKEALQEVLRRWLVLGDEEIAA